MHHLYQMISNVMHIAQHIYIYVYVSMDSEPLAITESVAAMEDLSLAFDAGKDPAPALFP